MRSNPTVLLVGPDDEGRALMASSEGLPWWRVVNSEGRLVPGHETEQARRLRREGVEVDGRHVRAFRSTRGGRRARGTMP